MNEFIEQFLLEGRELVAEATSDLLALEQEPQGEAHLNGAFRAFHTLKGGAGIIEFPDMVRAVHAVEGLLAAARSGALRLSHDDIGDCLAALDQVVQWLDEMEASGEVPAGAAARADDIERRLSRHPSGAPAPANAAAPPEDWVDGLLARNPGAAAGAATAVRYTPDKQSFFRNEDPLALVAALPGLLALDISPATPWPALDDFDPFACNLVIAALLSEASEAVAGHVKALLGPGYASQVEIAPAPSGAALPKTPPHLPARAVLEAQLALIAGGDGHGLRGRLGSARRVLVSVLTRIGRPELARTVDGELPRQLMATDRPALEAALADALGGIAEVAAPSAPPAVTPAAETGARSLRVSVERIDALVNLTGELTIAKNALAHAAALARTGSDPAALAVLLGEQQARLERLVGALQRSVFSIRVLPMRQVFARFPRLVRDLSAELGKPVTLITEGDDTEADKAIVEQLAEPLLHVVRNAVGHGIETAAERLAAGKPALATIRLRAEKRGDSIVVEVADDGRGIDLARVRQLAAERGLASPGELAKMSDTAATELIFAPGFSTAATVSTLSGRGVGMDAVRSAIERIGGTVAVETEPGQGTTIRFILPFSVMMTKIMTVEAGGQVFGIPLDSVLETTRVPRRRITGIGSASAFVHRDRTVPLVDLAGIVGAAIADAPPAEADVVIASIGDEFCGIEVERLGDRMEVMLKPVGGLLAGLRGLAGVTILGDGRVMLVLDVKALLQWQ